MDLTGGHRSSEKTLPQIGRVNVAAIKLNTHMSQPEIRNLKNSDPYSMGVQGIQGDADAVRVTVASSQKMDNTMAQIRKVQEAEARFNQKRVSNP